jgi:putative acetyltransferase
MDGCRDSIAASQARLRLRHPAAAFAMNVVIRAAEATDAEALARLYNSPRVVWGTLQLPYTSVEARRRRLEPQPGGHALVAEADRELVGHLNLAVAQGP